VGIQQQLHAAGSSRTFASTRISNPYSRNSSFSKERKLRIMEVITIPKFENEADEANWAYENREALSAVFHEAMQEGRVRQGTLKQRAMLETE
jgi:hypothetical protein